MYRVDKRLYLDEKKKKIVTGPPESAHLFKAKGQQVTQQELDKWGKQLRKHIPELSEEKKQRWKKPRDKSMQAERDKSQEFEPQPAEIEDVDNG